MLETSLEVLLTLPQTPFCQIINLLIKSNQPALITIKIPPAAISLYYERSNSTGKQKTKPFQMMLNFHIIVDKFRNVEKNISKRLEPFNLKEIFAEKNPALAKMMPGFVYRFINRMLHIEFLNDFLRRNGHLHGIAFVDRTVEEFNVREHIHGFENIPGEGRFIFASNHPLGGFDALLLMKNVEKKLGELKFLANDILMKIPNLRPVFIPVNKHGSNSREAAQLLDETYNSDIQILIFPAGLASRKIKGKIIDLEWKKHFIGKAIKHKRDIIPAFVEGRNSNRFYRWANARKFLKIKWNLEMFWLPDETVKHRDTDIHIYFGKPIPYATFDRSRTHSEWATWVKNLVYKLPKNAEQTN